MTAVTCFIRYELHMEKFPQFEEYARRWMAIIPRFGGIHHGYFMPSEGASDIAYAMFSFPSLAAYEQYRLASASDTDCQTLWAMAPDLMRRHERSFLKPMLPTGAHNFPSQASSA